MLSATVIRTAVAQGRGFEDAVSLESILFDPTALAGSPVFVVTIFESIRWRELIALIS